jgi:hypothetical protein
MDFRDYTTLKLTVGVAATIGLYSVLYRETKLYRFFEHIFIGLAVGWSIVALWTETLSELWWDRLMGLQPEGAGDVGRPGYWAYAFVVPLGLMAYFIFSQKHNWISRIPIGLLLGIATGQFFSVFWRQYGPQIQGSMKPGIPTTFERFTAPSPEGLSPEALATVQLHTYPSEAISNLVFMITTLCVLSYFIFSLEFRNKFLLGMSTAGRWLLMIGFGAIFGSTVMMRFSLLIDRMFFVWQEWLIQSVIGRYF